MISAIILQSRENIERTLKSVSWCDEVLVVRPGLIKNFSAVRNQALEKSKGEWVLFIDDDEEVTKELEEEILKQVQDDMVDGYYIGRRDFFFGRWLHFGETGNIKLLRLGKKSAGKWQNLVHETWEIKNHGELENPILHYPHPTIEDFVRQINFYTTIRAKEIRQKDLMSILLRLTAYPVGKFVYNYFINLGFLDGMAGFVVAYLMSLHSLVVGVKLYEKRVRRENTWPILFFVWAGIVTCLYVLSLMRRGGFFR